MARLDYPTECERWLAFQRERLWERLIDRLKDEGLEPILGRAGGPARSMTVPMSARRFGKLPPRYSFFLNTYQDARFTVCPKCRGKTRLRKFPP